MMSDIPLEELRRLHDEATPGRWEPVDQVKEHHHFKFLRAPECVIENDRGPSYATEILGDEDYDTKSADLQLIAAAKTYLPVMLDEIASLRTQLSSTQKAREDCRGAAIEECAKAQCENCADNRPLHKPSEWQDERHEWTDESGYHIQDCNSVHIRALVARQA